MENTIDRLLLGLPDGSIACEDARRWCLGKTWQDIFDTCPRGDWMLWLFKKTMPNDEAHLKLLIKAKAHCALTVRHLMKDMRSVNACEVAIRFADGLATREELAAAAAAADDAVNTAHLAYSYIAAVAAATAVYSNVYSDATDAIADAAAKIKNQLQTANICREYLPIEIWHVLKLL
jgi:hypothetical protein